MSDTSPHEDPSAPAATPEQADSHEFPVQIIEPSTVESSEGSTPVPPSQQADPIAPEVKVVEVVDSAPPLLSDTSALQETLVESAPQLTLESEVQIEHTENAESKSKPEPENPSELKIIEISDPAPPLPPSVAALQEPSTDLTALPTALAPVEIAETSASEVEAAEVEAAPVVELAHSAQEAQVVTEAELAARDPEHDDLVEVVTQEAAIDAGTAAAETETSVPTEAFSTVEAVEAPIPVTATLSEDIPEAIEHLEIVTRKEAPSSDIASIEPKAEATIESSNESVEVVQPLDKVEATVESPNEAIEVEQSLNDKSPASTAEVGTVIQESQAVVIEAEPIAVQPDEAIEAEGVKASQASEEEITNTSTEPPVILQFEETVLPPPGAIPIVITDTSEVVSQDESKAVAVESSILASEELSGNQLESISPGQASIAPSVYATPLAEPVSESKLFLNLDKEIAVVDAAQTPVTVVEHASEPPIPALPEVLALVQEAPSQKISASPPPPAVVQDIPEVIVPTSEATIMELDSVPEVQDALETIIPTSEGSIAADESVPISVGPPVAVRIPERMASVVGREEQLEGHARLRARPTELFTRSSTTRALKGSPTRLRSRTIEVPENAAPIVISETKNLSGGNSERVYMLANRPIVVAENTTFTIVTSSVPAVVFPTSMEPGTPALRVKQKASFLDVRESLRDIFRRDAESGRRDRAQPRLRERYSKLSLRKRKHGDGQGKFVFPSLRVKSSRWFRKN